ncbi:MAG: SRPBCC family protein [Deltaproteobacteria bacterium]|nr:SRPBCC family protein [Deltaproteobacteria bacterium]
MCSGFFGKRLCLLAAVLLFLCLQGCSTKYTITSPKYAEYEGEINQHTRLVRAERSHVFQVLTQEESFKKICPKGTIVTHESPPPYKVGTLVKTKIVHIFELEWNSRVEEVIPDSKIRLQFLDGFFRGGTEIWELESETEYTRVTHTIIIQPKGLLEKLAWALKARMKHNKMTEAVLDNLKRLCETHSLE